MARVLKREIAKRDLIRHFVYLAESASLETARRFKEATRRTLIQLSQAPEIGSPGKVSEGTFAGVRLWRVDVFDQYLIAYRQLEQGVVIERVFQFTPRRTTGAF
jgi:toxin ParE1/3/4